MLNPVAPLRVCCLLGMALLPEGCTSQPPALSAAEAEVSRRHAESVLREARNEAAMLRNDIAATRIAAAKKDAELEELRLRVAELRQKRTDQQHLLEATQTECAALRAERDRLLQTKTDFHVQLAELPHLRQVAAEARATDAGVQVRIDALESAVAGLKAELDQVKRALVRTQAKPGATPRRPAEAAEPAPPPRRP